MTEDNREIPEQVSLANAVNEATRGPRFGIFEQLLCTHIYLAANTPEPLKKIQHVTDAALMLDSEKQKTLEIDVERISVTKTVCTALSHAIKTRLPDRLRALVCVKFGFEPTTENREKYIDPWNIPGLDYYPEHISRRLTCLVFFCSSCNREVANSEDGEIAVSHFSYSSSCGHCGSSRSFKTGYRKAEKVSETEFLFGIFSALFEDGYITAINSFLQWSETFILETTRKLTEAVKPEIYNEVIRLYAAQREEGKQNVF